MMDTSSFGRMMMHRSGELQDDALCNAFAKVGSMLVRLGQPRSPRSLADMSKEDLETLYKALEMFNVELPAR